MLVEGSAFGQSQTMRDVAGNHGYNHLKELLANCLYSDQTCLYLCQQVSEVVDLQMFTSCPAAMVNVITSSSQFQMEALWSRHRVWAVTCSRPLGSGGLGDQIHPGMGNYLCNFTGTDVM